MLKLVGEFTARRTMVIAAHNVALRTPSTFSEPRGRGGSDRLYPQFHYAEGAICTLRPSPRRTVAIASSNWSIGNVCVTIFSVSNAPA
jgi:hypothetical protein